MVRNPVSRIRTRASSATILDRYGRSRYYGVMPPIRILGAGLSGLATALLLARRGLEVEVRHRGGGKAGRFWGGFQVLENGSSHEDVLQELARMGVEPQCDLVPLHEAVLVDQDLQRYEVASARPYAYLIRRGQESGTLDASLRAAVGEAGIAVSEGSEGQGRTPDVVATGPQRSDRVAMEVVFRTDHPDMIGVLFDPGLTPTGYSYLFVHDGVGTMGAAQVRQARRLRANARLAFSKLRQVFPMNMELRGSARGNFMNFGVPRHLRRDGTWYVGEAAGVQDFLFGLGNRLARRSCAVTAEAIAGEGWDQKRFSSEIVRPMEASVLGRFAYECAGPRLTSIACKFLARKDFRDRLLALQRPSRWRRLLARAVMTAWRDSSDCPRLPVARWCRRAER